jgi:hypothetical protein
MNIPSRMTNIRREFEYNVNETDLGPFEYPAEDLKPFLNTVAEFKINYAVKTYIPYLYDNNYECFYWVI